MRLRLSAAVPAGRMEGRQPAAVIGAHQAQKTGRIVMQEQAEEAEGDVRAASFAALSSASDPSLAAAAPLSHHAASPQEPEPCHGSARTSRHDAQQH